MSSLSAIVSYDNYILEKQVEKSKETKEPLVIVVLFLLSGIPSSVNLVDSLWCELPWFESSQPEGETLSSWFMLMQALGCSVVLCLLCFEIHVIIFPKISLLYCVSFGTVLMSVVLTVTWNLSVDGYSLFLHLASLTGLITGWVSMIFVIPWIANHYNPRLISAFWSGNTLMTFIMMSLSLIQEPGGSRYFSPSVYYIVVSIIYAATFAACVYTFQSRIGRLTSKEAVKILEPWRNSLWAQTFTPVFWETKMLTFGRIWMIHLTWSVVPIVLPYAAANTTSDESDGEDFLQWAIAMSFIMEFLGSASSYIPTGKYWIGESLAVNTIANGIIILSHCGIGVWSSWGMKSFLMTAVGISKFTYGWNQPLILRELSLRFPDSSELLVRSNSLWCIYSNIVVRFLLWMLSSGVISITLL